MGDINPVSTTTPAAKAVKTPRDNAIQNQAIANGISSAERMIKSIKGAPELLLKLAPAGYNEQSMNFGLELASATQTAYDERQKAMGAATNALAKRKAIHALVKQEHTTYRTTVQADYHGAVRANLGASGRVPANGNKFRTNVRTAYTTALASTALAKLSESGFNEERFAAALGALDELTTAESELQNAASLAQTATEARDKAHKALKRWVSKLRAIAKQTLKKRADLLALMKA